MKAIQILRKGNTRTLLTVAPDRISIKFQDGLEEREEQILQVFLMKVATELDGATTSTLRGTYMDDHFQITMKGGHISAPFSRTFKREDV